MLTSRHTSRKFLDLFVGPLSPDWILNLQLRKSVTTLSKSLLCRGQLVVDLGSGKSPYKQAILELGCRYISVDFSGADVQFRSSGDTDLPDGCADLVLSTQVLEHVSDTAAYLAEAKRILRDDGTLLLSTHGVWLFHPHPHDYRRWTKEGLVLELGEAGFVPTQTRSLVGPLGWTTMLRSIGYEFMLRRFRLLGRLVSGTLSLVMNARIVLEEAITPAWVREENACVYVAVCVINPGLHAGHS